MREADREAVADPAALDPPDAHRQVPRLDFDADADVRAQFRFRLGGVEEARRKDIAVAAAIGQRDVPSPAGRERSGAGRDLGALLRNRRRHHDRAVVEQIIGERAVRFVERTLDNRRPETARVNKQVGGDPRPGGVDQCRHLSVRIHIDRRDGGLDPLDSACDRDLAEGSSDQIRVEMIAVACQEREVRRRDRRAAFGGEAGRNEEGIGSPFDRLPAAASAAIMEKSGRGEAVDRSLERVEIGLEAGFVRPARKADAGLIGGVAARHPLIFGNAYFVEKALHLRGRSLADADNPDVL